jgi:hypothetical protein
MRARWIAGVVLGGVTSAFVPTWRTQAAALAQPKSTCSGTLAGREFPELIPEYWVWERFFDDISQPGSQLLRSTDLPPADAAVLKQMAAQAVANVRVIRAADPALEQVEGRAAEAIISARDALKRQLPEQRMRTASSIVYEQGSRREYKLPVTGKPRTLDDGTTQCLVSVKGKEHPELIPEIEAWRLYFLTYADVAEHISVWPDYNVPDLRGIQKSRLPISDDDLRRFLTFARDQGRLLEQLQDASADDKTVAQTVRAARDVLLRTVRSDVWMKLRKDAERTRKGIIFTFPPSAQAGSK